jgi:hypothetical protein
MKSKILIFLGACILGISTAMACSFSECGGGPDQCCTDVFGAKYNCTVKKPVKTIPPASSIN